jgi:hypothetical protein
LARAEKLNAGASNPLLAKYIEMASLQTKLSSTLVETFKPSPNGADRALLAYFDCEALNTLLTLVERQVGMGGQTKPTNESLQLLEQLWNQVEEFTYPRDLGARLVLEVFATELSTLPHREMETLPDRCPHCGFRILCSIAREEGMGRRRSVRCSLCSSEWAVPRLGCLRCGEQVVSKLTVFNFETWPHVRVDACDSCGGFLKSIDMTKEADALPVPDDVASSAINIWAFERGYEPIGRHLFNL